MPPHDGTAPQHSGSLPPGHPAGAAAAQANGYAVGAVYDYGYFGGPFLDGDGFNTMGMSAADQEAFKAARYSEIANRSRMQYMMALQAYQNANLTLTQIQLLQRLGAQSTKTANAGKHKSGMDEIVAPELANFVKYDQLQWPGSFKASSGTFAEKQKAVSKAVVAVHRQVLTQGHAEPEAVFAAKQSLGTLATVAAKSCASRASDAGSSASI